MQPRPFTLLLTLLIESKRGRWSDMQPEVGPHHGQYHMPWKKTADSQVAVNNSAHQASELDKL
jgi:hypothetical protein